jgi:hypothetical protein
MPTKYLATYIDLPPGLPPGGVMREFFQLAFTEYRWFKPVRYGVAFLNERLDPENIDFDALVAFYEERRTITVTARTDRDFFMVSPAKPDYPPYVGRIAWETSVTESRKSSWRTSHLRQVTELMRLLNSPLAQTGVAEDFDRKTRRLVPCADGFGHERLFTVRDYGEGLAGLFWRNFYGPPFVRLFGERLASLPPDTRQDLGDDVVLVQPYELPSQADTPEGDARERELISLLGPECFYDHERHLKPTRLPSLPLAAS